MRVPLTNRPAFAILWALILIAGAGGDSGAHQDPLGDVHPSVEVEDGHFSVYFSNNSVGDGYSENRPVFRVRYTREGKLVAPRHRVKAKSTNAAPVSIERFHNKRPIAKVRQPDGSAKVLALRWPEDVAVWLLKSACLSPDRIAAAVKHEGNEKELYLYLFPRTGFRPPEHFLIGSPEMIYSSPTASNVIFAKGRFWIAWVRGGEMVLSSIRPGEKKPVEQVLDTPGNWNSTLSLAVIEDHLCLAYHSSVNFEYPGRSSILTKFVRID